MPPKIKAELHDAQWTSQHLDSESVNSETSGGYYYSKSTFVPRIHRYSSGLTDLGSNYHFFIVLKKQAIIWKNIQQ